MVGASTPALIPGMGKAPSAAVNFSAPHRPPLWGRNFFFGEETGRQPQCITERRAHPCTHTHAHGSHTRVHAHGLPRGGARRPGPLLRETGREWHFNANQAGTMRCVFKGL